MHRFIFITKDCKDEVLLCIENIWTNNRLINFFFWNLILCVDIRIITIVCRNISLQACMHKLPVEPTMRGSQWPYQWPLRLEKAPYWLESQVVSTGSQGKKTLRQIMICGNVLLRNNTWMVWALTGQRSEMSWIWDHIMEGMFVKYFSPFPL